MRSKHFKRATFSVRFVAMSIDLMTVAILQMVLGGGVLLFYEFFCNLFAVGTEELMENFLSQLAAILLFVGYFTFSVGYAGNTLGKHLVHIQTFSDYSGRPLTIRQAFQRSLGYLLSSWTYLVGFFMAYFREDQKALHDLVCHTYVIEKEPLAQEAQLIRPIDYDLASAESDKKVG